MPEVRQLEAMYAKGLPLQTIADMLGRNIGTVPRALKTNGIYARHGKRRAGRRRDE